MHSDLDAIERAMVVKELREGSIDVIVGVNLLREGLDLPEVSLVAILEADKEGFFKELYLAHTNHRKGCKEHKRQSHTLCGQDNGVYEKGYRRNLWQIKPFS